MPRLEDETMLEADGKMVDQTVRKRRGPLAASSSGISSMGLGMRPLAQEEAQGMMATDILVPLVSELQEKMSQVRSRQQDAVNSGLSVASEIRKAMSQKREIQV